MENIVEGDFWSELPANIKIAIQEAKLELANGQGISHADIMEEVKNRFLKSIF